MEPLTPVLHKEHFPRNQIKSNELTLSNTTPDEDKQMPLYQICIYTVSAVSVDNIDLSYTSANYRAQQGQQSFGKYQATLSSNGKFAQSLCISTAILKFATISEPKAAFLKDTKNLFWGNEIVSNLKESFTTNKKKNSKSDPQPLPKAHSHQHIAE